MRKESAGPRVSRWSAPDAGWALAHTAPMQKHLLPLLGLSKGQVSLQCAGKKPSVVSRFHDLVREAVRGERSDAGYLIGCAVLTAEDEAAQLPLPTIGFRLREALSQETLFEAEENVAEHPVLVALGCFGPGREPTEQELRTLRVSLETHDEALRRETGREIDSLIYNRALSAKQIRELSAGEDGWRIPQ